MSPCAERRAAREGDQLGCTENLVWNIVRKVEFMNLEGAVNPERMQGYHEVMKRENEEGQSPTRT